MAINNSENTGTPAGILARQLGKTGGGLPALGMSVTDKDSTLPNATGVQPIYGADGEAGGGFNFAGESAGSSKEYHRIGMSNRGEIISAGHITTNALFKLPNRDREVKNNMRMYDAPLRFEEVSTIIPNPRPFSAKTHLQFTTELGHGHPAYGIKIGKWFWWTETSSGGSGGDDDDIPGDPDPPPAEPPSDPDPPPPPPPEDEDPPPDDDDGGDDDDDGGGGDDDDDGRGRPRSVTTYPGDRRKHGPCCDKGGGKGDTTPLPRQRTGSGGRGRSVSTQPGGAKEGGPESGCGGSPPHNPGDGKPPDDTDPPGEAKQETFAVHSSSGIGGGGGGSAGQREYLVTPAEEAQTSILAKGNPSIFGAPDYRSFNYRSGNRLLRNWINTAPITARLEAYAGYKDNAFFAVYTQEAGNHTSRFRSGTGPGGWLLMQPELDLADFREHNESATDIPKYTSGDVSDTSFTIAPLVNFEFGYPNLLTGTIEKGWHANIELDLTLDWHLKDGTGTDTTLVRFPKLPAESVEIFTNAEADNLKRGAGTPEGSVIGNPGDVYQNISGGANTTFYVKEFGTGNTGWVAYTGGAAGTSKWDRTGIFLSPATVGDRVRITNGSLASPGLQGVSGTTTGINIDGSGNIIFVTSGTEVARFTAGNDINVIDDLLFQSSTGFLGQIQHSNTADRKWLCKDSNGTFAFTSDIHWDRTGTLITPKIAGDELGITNGTVGSPGLQGVSSTKSGFNIDGSHNVIAVSNGVEVARFTDNDDLQVTNQIIFKDNTAFTGTLTHANTGNHTWTIPNRTGRVHVGAVEMVIPLSSLPDSFGDYAVKNLVANDVIRLNFKIPEKEFTSISSITLNGIVDASSDTSGQKFTFDFDYGAIGEDHSTHTQTNGATKDFTGFADKIVGVDMGSLPSITGDDHVGVKITMHGAFTGTFYGMSVTVIYEQ